MGNRAVISFLEHNQNAESEDLLGIYLHWQSSAPDVFAVLDVAKTLFLKETRSKPFLGNAELFISYFCRVFNTFVPGSLTAVNLAKNSDCNNGNNGWYICKNFEVLERKYAGSESNKLSYKDLSEDEKKRYDWIKELIEKRLEIIIKLESIKNLEKVSKILDEMIENKE